MPAGQGQQRGGGGIGRAAVLAALLGGACTRPGLVLPATGYVPRAPGEDVVPAGTLLSAQLRQPLSTSTSRPGDRFTAELLDPIVDGTGHLLVPAGALVEGVVGGVDPSKVAGDGAALSLELTGVRTDGEGLLALPLEVADAPVSLTSAWGQIAGLSLAGAAVGAGVGVAIDSSEAAVPIALGLVGVGVGALFGQAVGRRDANVAAGSILTLRVSRDVRASEGLAKAAKGE